MLGVKNVEFFTDIYLCGVILGNFLNEIVSLSVFLNFFFKKCVYDVIIPGARVMFSVEIMEVGSNFLPLGKKAEGVLL